MNSLRPLLVVPLGYSVDRVFNSASNNGPIVAVVDSPTEATGNKPSTDSASDIIAATQQVLETCSGTGRVVVIAFETDQPTLYDGQQCIAVLGKKDLIASVDCLDPSTIAVGQSAGTTLQRCFSTTTLASVLSCGHNVFFPGPSRPPAETSLARNSNSGEKIPCWCPKICTETVSIVL